MSVVDLHTHIINGLYQYLLDCNFWHLLLQVCQIGYQSAKCMEPYCDSMIDRVKFEIVLWSNIRWWSQTSAHTGCAKLRFASALLRLCHWLAVADEL
jgi:hypothetical protein